MCRRGATVGSRPDTRSSAALGRGDIRHGCQVSVAPTTLHEVEPDDIRLASVARLAEAASEGDHRSWLELVSRFAGMVATVASGHRLAPADVSAVQQATWL